METKAARQEVLYKLAQQAERDLIAQGKIKNRYGSGSIKPAPTPESVDFSNIDLFFLFSPTCTACEQQAAKLKSMKRVVPMQVLGKELKHYPGLPNSTWADQETIRTYVKTGLPVTLLYNRKTNSIIDLTGVTDARDLARAAAATR